MKKILYLLLFAVLIVGVLAGCSENDEKQGLNIIFETPLIMSNNSVNLANGNIVFINIEMISGRYYYDEMPGAFQGSNWNGHYQVRVYTNEYDFSSTAYLAPISLNDNEEMVFNSSFSLIFDDYNNDGNPDFTLGQYSSGNGFDYAIFSINQNGEVERLNTDNKLMFINMREYSVQLEKHSPTSFKFNFYDNSIGEYIERIYQWEEDKFVVIE